MEVGFKDGNTENTDNGEGIENTEVKVKDWW